MTSTIRVLSVCGSLQANSGNRRLLARARELAPPTMRVTAFERLAELPHFNPDIDPTTVAAVGAWRAAISASDALLIACPEYGHSLPGALKNAIDWVIGTGELESKVVATTASTPAAYRGLKGLLALSVTLGAVSAQLVGGEPIARDDGADEQLTDLLGQLAAACRERRDTVDPLA